MKNTLIKKQREQINKKQKWERQSDSKNNPKITKSVWHDRSEGKEGEREKEREKSTGVIVEWEERRATNLPRLFGSASGGETSPEETKESTGNQGKGGLRKRNTKRGLRSRKATEERRIKRTNKRGASRRKWQKGKRRAGKSGM